MPRRRYRRKRTYRRKSYGRRKRIIRKKKNRASKVVIRTPNTIPDRCMVKLKWGTDKPQVTASGVAGDYRVNLNGIYDPQYDTGGDQPNGFDEWMGFYSEYQVHAAKVRVQFLNNGSTNTMICGIQASNDVTQIADCTNETDRPYTQTALLQPLTGTKCDTNFKMYVSIKKIAGVKELDETQDTGNNGANPNREVILHIFSQDFLKAGATTGLFRLKVTYYVEFSKRKALDHS